MTTAEYGIASAQIGAENPAYLWRAHGKIPTGAKFPHRWNSHSVSDFGLPQQMLKQGSKNLFLASAGFLRLDSNWGEHKTTKKVSIPKKKIWKKYLFHVMLRSWNHYQCCSISNHGLHNLESSLFSNIVQVDWSFRTHFRLEITQTEPLVEWSVCKHKLVTFINYFSVTVEIHPAISKRCLS